MSGNRSQPGETSLVVPHENGISEDPVHVVEYDYTEPGLSLDVAIVEAVSEATSIPPTEIVGRLNDVVDTDALKRAFRPLPDDEPRTGWLTFFLCGCRITVSSDGRVRIYDR